MKWFYHSSAATPRGVQVRKMNSAELITGYNEGLSRHLNTVPNMKSGHKVIFGEGGSSVATAMKTVPLCYYYGTGLSRFWNRCTCHRCYEEACETPQDLGTVREQYAKEGERRRKYSVFIPAYLCCHGNNSTYLQLCIWFIQLMCAGIVIIYSEFKENSMS